MINNMPAAIRKLPQTNVLGNRISTALAIVITPLTITPGLENCHLPNSSSISGFSGSHRPTLLKSHEYRDQDKDSVNDF